MIGKPASPSLKLWSNERLVGTWSTNPGGADTLHYHEDWVSAEDSWPVSLSLPFRPNNAPHEGRHVRAYFENLLPDSEEILKRAACRYTRGSTDSFDLLAQIGCDCAGGLQILPEHMAPAFPKALNGRMLGDDEVAKILRATVSDAVSPAEDQPLVALAGAQEKTALLYLDGKWYLPKYGTATTHILKLPMGLIGNQRLDLSESVENEWLCSLILNAYGLPVARCNPVSFAGIKALAVERFDRQLETTGQLHRLNRLPQEDLCQAHGLAPHKKYESDGGPGIERIMKLLEGSITPAEDKLAFFKAQIVFWMLCAPDGHAKNFSIQFFPGGKYKLAPLYDVLSAHPLLGEGPSKISGYRVKLAMAARSKNAHWKVREIQRKHWMAVAERHDVVSSNGQSPSSIIDGLVASTPEVIRKVRARLPLTFPLALADSVLHGMQSSADRLAR